MPRTVFLSGTALVLVAIGLAVTDWALSLQPGVTEANTKRVRGGMTLAEVEVLLGGPPSGSMAPGTGSLPSIYLWVDNRGIAVVYTNEDSQRVKKTMWCPTAAPLNPLDRLRSWLGW